MPEAFKPRTDILPKAQQEIWPLLAPSPKLSLVLYGGTAVALHLGHRVSVDFDFFRSAPLDKKELETAFSFLAKATTLQDEPNTIVASVPMPAGSVKVSFFGGLTIGRINKPLRTKDPVLLVASLEDLLATKLKAILDRAEAKDYRDIAAMLAAGTSLARGLGAFVKMYGENAAIPLKAIGYFKDGDLPTLSAADQKILRTARDRIGDIPDVAIVPGPLSG